MFDRSTRAVPTPGPRGAALTAALFAALLAGAPVAAPGAEPVARAVAPAGTRPPDAPRNVIFLIADGMGPAYASLARGVAGRPLALDSIVVGSSSTGAADSPVTDSGAAATALACGVHTLNQAIGVCPAGLPRRSVLEAAESRGMATGLVATSRITHATPAAFAAHVPHRNDEDAIAAQMLERGIEVLLGGGARHFLPEGAGGRRRDGRDLVEEARRRGVTFVADRDALRGAGPGPVLGLFAASHMSYALDRDPAREPSLPEMARAAIERLARDPDGFFLMVEGSRVDHAGHVNDAASAAREAIEFDEAVAAALAFARADGRTLVVVTADHETGGLSLGAEVDGTSHYEWRPEVLRAQRRSAGAMAERIAGGADPRAVLAGDAGVGDLRDDEAAAIAAAGGEERTVAIARAVSRRARIGWTTRGHTAVDVPVWAFGPGAGRLRGLRSNDALGRSIAACLGLEIGAVLSAGAPPAAPAPPATPQGAGRR